MKKGDKNEIFIDGMSISAGTAMHMFDPKPEQMRKDFPPTIERILKERVDNYIESPIPTNESLLDLMIDTLNMNGYGSIHFMFPHGKGQLIILDQMDMLSHLRNPDLGCRHDSSFKLMDKVPGSVRVFYFEA